MQIKLITLIAALAVGLLGFGASFAGAASGCAESVGCEPVGKRPSSSDLRATFRLVRLGSSNCGSESYAIVVNERRKAIVC